MTPSNVDPSTLLKFKLPLLPLVQLHLLINTELLHVLLDIRIYKKNPIKYQVHRFSSKSIMKYSKGVGELMGAPFGLFLLQQHSGCD